ncbi:MAG: B12-binding domain-containing radical SAM protein [Caldisphaeraceae archaeon]|nr:B12-binding domain-containing radical SAM protein [Caldisphaeraceae archaeon]
MKSTEVIERGLVEKKFRKGMKRVALFYPSNYAVGMSSLIFHRLYYLLNDIDDFYVERFFMDSIDEYGVLKGVERKTPLRNFDYILIPVHYELDYVNIVNGLKNSGIEVLSRNRRRPKVIVGGPVVTSNPEPLAEIADIEIIGELEAVWRKIIDIMTSDVIEAGLGIYVPAYGKYEVRVAHAESLDSSDFRRISTSGAKFDVVLEAMRGCPFSCMFCMESFISKPARYKPFDKIKEELYKLRERYRSKITLVGLTINSHPDFRQILSFIREEGMKVSIPSLRADLLREEDIEIISSLGQRNLTIAVENSERVRRALGKEFSNDSILNIAKYAKRYGLSLKIYLITSIPGESEEDIKEVIELTRGIKKIGVRKISLSLNPLVIKPATPLQWLPMNDYNTSLRKIMRIKSEASYDEISIYDPFYALVQGSISLSDRDIIRYLLRVPDTRKSSFRAVAKDGMLSYALSKKEDPLPWSHIKGYVDEESLRKMLHDFLEKMHNASASSKIIF